MRILIGLLIFATVFGTSLALAQQPADNKTWQVVVDADGRGEIKRLAVAENGDLLVSGFLDRAGPSIQGSATDAWVARYSPDGRQLWSQRLGGPLRDEALDMLLSPDGSIIITGWRDVQFTQKVSTSSGFVAKFSPSGALLWQAVIADASRQIDLSHLMLLDDGSMLAEGQDTPNDTAGSRALVVKVSADGHIQWMFNPPDFVAGATPTNERAMRVRKPDGSEYVFEGAELGRVTGNETIDIHVMQGGTFEGFDERCFVVSLASGKLVDDKCGPLPPGESYRSGQPTTFSGGTIGGFADGDPVIRKRDASGTEIWVRTLKSDIGDGVNAVAATPDGGVVGAGFVLAGPTVQRDNWDGLLIRLDKDGQEVWRRRLGGSRRDELNGVAVLADGSIVVAGYTGSQGAVDWQPWLMRLNSSGELEGTSKKQFEQSNR